MSYTVFALKWRPKNFDEIIGQNHIVATLKSVIQKNRVANAYLFAGPRGVGKTSTARILAKSLNCQNGPTVNPCQKCPACIEISEGRSFDVIEIDGASNRGIDEIRVLRENAKFSPASGKYKIYIIDEVHMLTQEAFNALLKTLEEPPPFVKFIFATTQPHKVISTILSRCQRFDFRRITLTEVIAQLDKIVTKEGIDIDKEVLFAIAKSSDGSLRDAETILDQLVSFSKERISLKDVISLLGIVEQEALFGITDKIIQKDPKAVLGLVNKLIDDGKDVSLLLTNLIEHFRNLMIAKVTGGDVKLIDLPQDSCERLLKQSEAFSLEDLFSAFNILVNAQDMSKRLDSLRIPLEVSLVRLAHDKKTASPLANPHKYHNDPRYPQTKEKVQQETPLGEEVVPPEPADKSLSSISIDKVRDAWDNVIESLGRIKMSVATYLSEGEPVKVQGGVLTVSFPKNYSLHKESLEKKENKGTIERILSELLNANLKVNFMLSAESKQKKDSEDNPFIKSALETFNGRVVKEQ